VSKILPISLMLWTLTLLSGSGASAQTTKSEDFTKGAYLYRQCRYWGMKGATDTEVDEANQCLAYIEGFVDGKGPTYKFGCFIGASYQEMISAYLEWMPKHPDYLQVHKRLGLDAALTTKFCSGWKEPPKTK
jgi:hypothetical protein